MIVLVTGPAGSGKSTLGHHLARLLRVPFLDLDTVTNPLLDQLTGSGLLRGHWNDPALRDVIRPARYAALLAVLEDQVRVGSGAVVVAPFTSELQGGPEWEALVEASGSSPQVIWLRASSELLAARRGARSADRDSYIVDASGGAAPSIPHLAVDASLTSAQQVAVVRRSLSIARPLAVDSTVFARRFAAALFDLDGTLIDSTPAVDRSWTELARAFDLGNVVALHGAEDLLDGLPQQAKAIVTSGTRLIATNRLEAAGITPPPVLVTFDDVTHGKPDPEPFLLAAQRLGVDPADCLVFGDSPAGLASARAAGCATVSILGTHEEHELDSDLVVDGWRQLSIEVLSDGGLRLRPADGT